MNGLIGFGLVPFLILFSFLLMYISEYTAEYPLVLVGILIFGDALIAGTYYFIGKDFVDNEDDFRIGMGLSFMFATMFRAIFFLIYAKKKGHL